MDVSPNVETRKPPGLFKDVTLSSLVKHLRMFHQLRYSLLLPHTLVIYSTLPRHVLPFRVPSVSGLQQQVFVKDDHDSEHDVSHEGRNTCKTKSSSIEDDTRVDSLTTSFVDAMRRQHLWILRLHG